MCLNYLETYGRSIPFATMAVEHNVFVVDNGAVYASKPVPENTKLVAFVADWNERMSAIATTISALE